jgi:hypothetical protein
LEQAPFDRHGIDEQPIAVDWVERRATCNGGQMDLTDWKSANQVDQY